MRWFVVVGCCLAAHGQQRSVVITVDDLPFAAGGVVADRAVAEAANRKMLAAFKAHRVPATGFVNEKTVEALGAASLKEWIAGRFDLGNHTYSHPDINLLSVAQIEQEIIRGEATIGPLMAGAGKRLRDFRFPMNHTGDTKEKHDALAAILAGRGYRAAASTIDTSDYLFNAAYVRMLERGDEASARRLRAEYVAYSSTEIDYYTSLNKQVFGYEPPHVMLLHLNRLNADVIEDLLRLFEKRWYRFVTLDEAQSHEAYRTPETFVTKFGPMWGYRWARVLGVKVDGRLETEPPQWVLDYGK